MDKKCKCCSWVDFDRMFEDIKDIPFIFQCSMCNYTFTAVEDR